MKNYEDLSVAEGIELGLRQAIQIQRGELQAGRITTVEVPDCKKVREKTGLSQEKFATTIGVPRATISNWEQGRNNPTGAALALLKIIEALPEALSVLQNNKAF